METMDKFEGGNQKNTQEAISDLQFSLAKKIKEVVNLASDEDKRPIARKWGELEELIREAKNNSEKKQ